MNKEGTLTEELIGGLKVKKKGLQSKIKKLVRSFSRMKMSQFAQLNILCQMFGRVAVLDTYRKLKKLKFQTSCLYVGFPERTATVDPRTAATFLYCLMAQRTPADVPAITAMLNGKTPDGVFAGNSMNAIKALGQILFTFSYAQQIESVEVSKLTGELRIIYYTGRREVFKSAVNFRTGEETVTTDFDVIHRVSGFTLERISTLLTV
jgi:hypothetical protein